MLTYYTQEARARLESEMLDLEWSTNIPAELHTTLAKHVESSLSSPYS